MKLHKIERGVEKRPAAVQLLNLGQGKPAMRRDFPFGRETLPHQIRPPAASHLQAQRQSVEKQANDLFPIHFFRAAIAQQAAGNICLAAKKAHHALMGRQKDGFQRHARSPCQILQTLETADSTWHLRTAMLLKTP